MSQFSLMNKIGVFSVPRSGSTWLGQLFNSHPNVNFKFQPNLSYSFKPTLSENSTGTEIAGFFQELSKTKDKFVNAEISISSKENISFEKKEFTKLVFKETHYLHIIENLLFHDIFIVGLVRSPFAVINSWIKIPKEFNPEWSISEEWILAPKKNQNKNFNYFGYKKWKETCFQFLELSKSYPLKFRLVQYEHLLANPQQEVMDLFEFCGLRFDKQTKDFLDLSKSKNDLDAYSIFRTKNRDDQWKDSLPEFIINEIQNDPEFKILNDYFKWV